MKRILPITLVAFAMLIFGSAKAQTNVNFTVVDPNCVGIETLQYVNQLRVYPNPSEGDIQLSITFGSQSPAVLIQVYNINGAEVFSKTYEKPGMQLNDQFNFNSFAAGVYQMKFTIDRKSYTTQFVIK